MSTFTSIGLAAVLLGSAGIYLSSPNQRWLAAPWPLRPARIAGALMLALGWLSLAREMQSLTATFVFLTVLMLTFSTLPYIGAFMGARRER